MMDELPVLIFQVVAWAAFLVCLTVAPLWILEQPVKRRDRGEERG